MKDLIPADLISVISDNELTEKLTRASNYLPSLRCCDGKSKAVSGKFIGIGNFAICFSGGKYTDMGEGCHVLNFGFRYRASIFDGDKPPTDFWDPESTEFQEVTELALTPKTQGYNSGLEYLVYVPDASVFCCFYMGNYTGRHESDSMKKLVGKGAYLKNKLIKRSGGDYWGYDVLPSSLPMKLPEKPKILAAIEIFKNPKGKQVLEETSRVR